MEAEWCDFGWRLWPQTQRWADRAEERYNSLTCCEHHRGYLWLQHGGPEGPFSAWPVSTVPTMCREAQSHNHTIMHDTDWWPHRMEIDLQSQLSSLFASAPATVAQQSLSDSPTPPSSSAPHGGIALPSPSWLVQSNSKTNE